MSAAGRIHKARETSLDIREVTLFGDVLFYATRAKLWSARQAMVTPALRYTS